MAFQDTQNPGIGGLDELTDAETLVVQQISALGDPNADRILFWDDSAGAFAYLTAGTGLTITNTTISASGATLDGSGTTNEIAYWVDSDTLGTLAVATYPSLTELSYVKGVTSAIQTQINTKAPSTSPTFATSITGSYLTASEMLITDGSKNIVSAAVATYPSLTELTYLKGVTSAIQTQIDSRVADTGDTMTGLLTISLAGAGIRVVNTTDSASVQVAKLEGDRATMADDDAAYISLMLSNDGGTQKEFARLTWVATDVNAGTGEDGALDFGLITAGTLVDHVRLNNTTLRPITNDSHALGSATLSWSDLYLASGAVINFNNGNVTLTHSAGVLTLGGTATLALGSNSMTMTGSLAATGARVTKGWFTDIESTNMPTVGGTAILTSLTAPQFTTIELGHASDTTLSRSAAGVLAVEGVVIPSISSTNTLTNKRITKRTGTTTSSATPTINTDNVDFYSITAQTEAITSFTTNLSGTPTEGQTLWIAITGTAARAITWGASFEASTVALPTTTVTTNRLDVGFVWNTVTSKWRCIASA